ncbi:MAG: Ig-like domain-containing protein, partial [Akkermansiaceae bacterium]|nr:Ig-like domain-containing protein [Akkermansiaceae bacterium]
IRCPHLCRRTAIPAALILALASAAPAQTPGVIQDLEIIISPADGSFVRWFAHPGRTYFIQASNQADHLRKWNFLPCIEVGNSQYIEYGVDGTADKAFFRLKYTLDPIPPGVTPEACDFDNDGLSNQTELEVTDTDPLEPDTDHDGFWDGEEITAVTDPLDPLSFPIKVTASVPVFQPGDDAYLGHSCGQPVILHLNQPLPTTATITNPWIIDLNGGNPVPVAGTTTILPGRQAIAFTPTGNSFTPWPENQESPPVYEIDFTIATTGLSHLLPFHKTFTTTTADGSLDCGPWIGVTSPASDFIDVACDTIPTVNWSEPLDPATVIPANASLVPDGGSPVAISVDFDYGVDVNQLRITPALALVPATRYTVTIGTGFQNLTGKSHAQAVSWSFTTRPERSTPVVGAGPCVVAVSPSDFSFGIAPPDSVSITFSEDMDPSTLNAESIHLRAGNGADLPGTFTYAAATHTLTFQPTAALPFSAYHSLVLDLERIFNNATVESGDRKALQAADSFVFSTGNATGGTTTVGTAGTQAPAGIAPLCIHYTWATLLGVIPNYGAYLVTPSPPGCSVTVTLIDRNGGTKVETLPANSEANQVRESGPIAPATTVVITPHLVPGSHQQPDLTNSGGFILPSDGTPPPGMTYLVLRTTPPVGGSGADTVECLGHFGGASPITAGWVQDGAAVRGPQSIYLVPVPVERSIPGSGVWTLIEGQAAKALPGQKMLLRLQDLLLSSYGPPGVTLNGFQWTIPDKSFKDYVCTYTAEADPTSGTITELPAGDALAQDIGFYWADSGVKSLQVSYNLNLDGSVAGQDSSGASLHLEKITSTLVAKTGVDKVGLLPLPYPPVQSFGYFPTVAADLYGMIFTGTVTTPPEWPAGCWNSVQLIKSKRLFTSAATGAHTYMGDGVTFNLDTQYAYAPAPFSGNPVVAGSYPADGSIHFDKDLPSEPIVGGASISCDESFETYLMFKPPGSDSRYVPLRKLEWQWGGSVSAADGWTTVTSPKGGVAPTVTECSDHPQWSANSKADPELPVP